MTEHLYTIFATLWFLYQSTLGVFHVLHNPHDKHGTAYFLLYAVFAWCGLLVLFHLQL